MLIVVTFLILLSRFSYPICGLRTCVPFSQFVVNNKICKCNQLGQWSESDCSEKDGRRESCTPGEFLNEECPSCVCQPNGQFICTDKPCEMSLITTSHHFKTPSPWCTPFRSYYIDCNICHCPASRLLSKSHCVQDASCTLNGQPSFSDPSAKLSCIPKVMYLFTCMHCLCSDDGYFKINKCVETCSNTDRAISGKCIPKSFYRKNCNLCRCSDSGVPDDRLCSKEDCNETNSSLRYLEVLRVKSYKCYPHRFVKPRCLYCDCTSKGFIDESACLELGCVTDFKYDSVRQNCSVGETVPFCIECFCLRNGHTSSKYCTKSCSYESKIRVLESIIKNSITDDSLIDRKAMSQRLPTEVCEPGSIYADHGRYCLCPDNGYTNFNLCTAIQEIEITTKVSNVTVNITTELNYNITCDPNTFVEFDCNTCFCNKKGEIDKIWCTQDDCESKRIIQEAHEYNKEVEPVLSENCFPGSITRMLCNFCLCPESGLVKELVCTKNDCTNYVLPPNVDKFTCEPLAYYEVDCNICFCPRDGMKNVAKCTKNHCERSYLRSDVCVPGQLFSDECNVCICPPNGNKSEKACTYYTCTEPTTWKKIFQISDSILANEVEDSTRSLELCFPGEEFVVGCKLCVCPELGLRAYATCSQMMCDDDVTSTETPNSQEPPKNITLDSSRRTEDCYIYNVTVDDLDGRAQCNPGSMYIIKCKQCICPYMGNINHFCRPMPPGAYCEQAYPGYNYMPMGRRDKILNSTEEVEIVQNGTVFKRNGTHVFVIAKHMHTKHECVEAGRIMDKCFICECIKTNNTLQVIEEHCFKSNSTECKNSSPVFLKSLNKDT